jgi:hypothetical protein
MNIGRTLMQGIIRDTYGFSYKIIKSAQYFPWPYRGAGPSLLAVGLLYLRIRWAIAWLAC